MLKLEIITKDYVTPAMTVQALKGVSLEFRKNEFVSILGPSGCGKTTLLNIVGGLDRYTSGDLMIKHRSTKDFKDRDWDKYRNHSVGFVFQSYNLIPHQTVLGNVELSLTIAGISKIERTERAKAALDKVGLGDQYRKHPNQLSGGQMQRVAIARALVNDPEIILADEPTGALDTVTSKQIMELLREVAKERLVIMVTHNGELANEYSSRIIRLKDGEVIEDTNPFKGLTAAQREQEAQKEIRAKAEAAAKAAADAKAADSAVIQQNKGRRKRTKMSLVTAFRLSLQNLFSKRRRSIMVTIAGSIGIIGVSLVLAFSFGIQGFITNMQEDMLSGNPIEVQRSGMDLSAMMSGASFGESVNITRDVLTGKVNVAQEVETLYEAMNGVEDMFYQNTITPDYLEYLQGIPNEQLAALFFDYGLDLNSSIYTSFRDNDSTVTATKNERDVSLITIMNTYSSLLQDTNLSRYAHLIGGVAPGFSQLPKSNDDYKYIRSQYELLYGDMPKTKNDVVLVLSEDKMVSDLMLAQLGYYSQQEFLNVVLRVTEGDKFAEHELYNEDNLDNTETRDRISYEELLDKEFMWYANDDIFKDNFLFGTTRNPLYPFSYNAYANNIDDAAVGEPLNVVGILQPKKGTSFGMLQAGLFYTTELAEHIITTNKDSALVKYLALPTTSNQQQQSNVILYHEGAELPIDLAGVLPFIPNSSNLILEFVPGTTTISKITAPAGGFEIAMGIIFDYTYTWKNTTRSVKGTAGSMGEMQMMMGFFGSMLGNSSDDEEVNYTLLTSGTMDLQQMGGNSVLSEGVYIHIPARVAVYPITLKQKTSVLEYLDRWNSDENIILTRADASTRTIYAFKYDDATGQVLTDTAGNPIRDRDRIIYSDPLSIIFTMISQMVNLVTIALIAFTSLALVVSSVMIGIITYVSVVERIKEIGVIRSLGGRKRDVANLFTAETFILGLAAGIFGVCVTWIISWIVSAIVWSTAKIAAIAFLPVGTAVIMVLLSVILTTISGLLPSRSAARKDPVVALRTE